VFSPSSPVPADLQSAGIELGDLQSPMLTLALMAFSCFGGKDNGFHTITQAFFLALQMLIFKVGGLQIHQNRDSYPNNAFHACKDSEKT
jgi:hypothetical protein